MRNETKGEWVQAFTRRGAPRSGASRLRWRSDKDKRQERIAAVVVVVLVFAALIAPSLFTAGVPW